MPEIPPLEFWVKDTEQTDAAEGEGAMAESAASPLALDLNDLLSPTSKLNTPDISARDLDLDGMLASSAEAAPGGFDDAAGDAAADADAGADAEMIEETSVVASPAEEALDDDCTSANGSTNAGSPAPVVRLRRSTYHAPVVDPAPSEPPKVHQRRQSVSEVHQRHQSMSEVHQRRQSVSEPREVPLLPDNDCDYPQQNDFGAIIAHALGQVANGLISTPTQLDMSFAQMSFAGVNQLQERANSFLLSKPALDNLERNLPKNTSNASNATPMSPMRVPGAEEDVIICKVSRKHTATV